MPVEPRSGCAINAAVEVLGDNWSLIVLRDIEHMSYEQIQSITGLAEGTVKSRLHRARATLQAAVESSLGETIR